MAFFLQVVLPAQQETSFEDSLPRQDLGTLESGGSVAAEISLTYAEVGDHKLQIKLHADLPEDPSDKVDTSITQSTTISISIPFKADYRLRYEASTTAFASLLSLERLKRDFFEKVCEATVYTIISQKTHLDLIIHDIEYKHTVKDWSWFLHCNTGELNRLLPSTGPNQLQVELYFAFRLRVP